jgi:hypothetical protein
MGISEWCVLWLCAVLLLTGCAVSEPPPPEPPVQEAVAWVTITPPATTPISTIVPTEQALNAGLRWRECIVTSFDWREGEACLGYSLSALKDSGTAGTRTEGGELVLHVNGDVYETRTLESGGPLPRASLHKNGRRMRTFFDGTPVHSPNISLRHIDGKVAWEFSGERVQTIIYDGKDLRAQVGLDAAYRPYELDGKLAFIGEKDDAYFVVYDGEQVGPPFDLIAIGYCCEIALYAPRFGEERYVFWGQREGSSYVVEITPVGQAGR